MEMGRPSGRQSCPMGVNAASLEALTVYKAG